MANSDSTGTRLIEADGPSDANPGPVPLSAIRRWEALWELYRQAASEDPESPGRGPIPNESGRG